jgi:hypothetical protein
MEATIADPFGHQLGVVGLQLNNHKGLFYSKYKFP